ncbi:MAG: hypothetical protein LUH45_05370, partial [Clostridiales bacterium]|nr:hypothetical protein [Clostridiales bacterium]
KGHFLLRFEAKTPPPPPNGGGPPPLSGEARGTVNYKTQGIFTLALRKTKSNESYSKPSHPVNRTAGFVPFYRIGQRYSCAAK